MESKEENYGFFSGTVSEETVEFVSNEDSSIAVKSQPEKVEKGEKISISYPQEHVTYNSKTCVVMKRRKIDADTADITTSYIVVYEPGDGDEGKTFVSNFSI